MIKSEVPGVEFIVANTDAQDLQQSKAQNPSLLRAVTPEIGGADSLVAGGFESGIRGLPYC